jgi:hypothetical protein
MVVRFGFIVHSLLNEGIFLKVPSFNIRVRRYNTFYPVPLTG